MSDALLGARVLVTRPREAASELVEGLAARGAQVVVLPAIAILPPEDPAPLHEALERLTAFDWVVFTSANAVRAVLDQVSVWPAGPRVAAVGEATARVLRACGVEPHWVGSGTAHDLARELLGRGKLGRVLFPRGDRARFELAEALHAAQVPLEAPVAYRTVSSFDAAARAELERLLAARQLDWAVLASPSAWTELLSALSEPTLLANLRLAAIGPTTARAIRASGHEVHAEAVPPGVGGLLAALDRLTSRS